jgi:hypothetical protein
MLRVMDSAAESFLGAGDMNLGGRASNEQEFIANPQRMWLVARAGR